MTRLFEVITIPIIKTATTPKNITPGDKHNTPGGHFDVIRTIYALSIMT
jgi:hypothetical protein